MYGQLGKFHFFNELSMKEIRKTSQFKKDYKRFSKDLTKVKLLFSIVEKLAKGEDLPSEFKPHQLKGEWKDYMVCHIVERGKSITNG